MGAVEEDAREVYETGREPDFHITGIGRYEDAGDGMIRIYVTSRRGRLDKTEYSFHGTPSMIAELCRQVLEIVSEHHNVTEFRKALREH